MNREKIEGAVRLADEQRLVKGKFCTKVRFRENLAEGLYVVSPL